MNGVFKIEELKEILKNEKSIKIIIFSGIIIIFLLLISGLFPEQEKNNADSGLFNYKRQEEYENALEERLCGILSQIEGTGNIDIMITLESSEHNEYQKNGDDPVYTEAPKIRGVIVVCDGGNNIIIREKIISAVSGAFGISTTRVSVIK